MIERVRLSDLAGRIVVATSTDEEDDVIQTLCKQDGMHCFRGDREDCLDWHYQTALLFNADAVVKIPSDCPLIDPDIIDRVIRFFLNNATEFDYVSNLHPASYRSKIFICRLGASYRRKIDGLHWPSSSHGRSLKRGMLASLVRIWEPQQRDFGWRWAR